MKIKCETKNKIDKRTCHFAYIRCRRIINILRKKDEEYKHLLKIRTIRSNRLINEMSYKTRNMFEKYCDSISKQSQYELEKAYKAAFNEGALFCFNVVSKIFEIKH